jgi:hypothetical protein
VIRIVAFVSDDDRQPRKTVPLPCACLPISGAVVVRGARLLAERPTTVVGSHAAQLWVLATSSIRTRLGADAKSGVSFGKGIASIVVLAAPYIAAWRVLTTHITHFTDTRGNNKFAGTVGVAIHRRVAQFGDAAISPVVAA